VGFSHAMTAQVNAFADDSEFIAFMLKESRKGIRRADEVNLSSRNHSLHSMQVTSFDVRSRTP